MDSGQGLFSSGGASPVDPATRSTLLAEFMGHVLGAGTASEERLANANPSLHFRLRATFGSFGRALSSLLDQLPAPDAFEPVFEALRRHWATGRALDQGYFLRNDPILGKVILTLFESFDAAIREAGLDPALARRNRVLSDDEMLQRARVVSATLKNRVGKDWEVEDPLLMMNVRAHHPSYQTFFAWLDQRLGTEQVLVLVQQKRRLVAVPLLGAPEGSRGGVGRTISDLKFERAFHCRSRNILVLTAGGWAYRIPSDWVPVVGSEADLKLEIRRSDRITAVLDEPGQDELLVLVSDRGRIKAVPREDFKRFPAEGIRALGLEDGDSLALAISARPEGPPLAVFSRRGRALRLPMENIRLKSRQARGVLHLQFQDEHDGPVAAFQLADDDPYLVASPEGRIKAGLGGLIPLRLHGGLGVMATRGNLAGAASLGSRGIGLLSRHGRLLIFSSEELRILSRSARGVRGISLRSGDRLDFVFSVPVDTPQPEK